MLLDRVFELSPRELLVGLVAVLGLYYFYSIIAFNRKIASLGGRAPRVPSKLPLGIDFVYKAIKFAGNDENLALWHQIFMRHGNPANPYTCETNTIGRRVIFTADYENIKAILATQFNDYGKGPQFNAEWHAFLGDSIFSTDHQKWHDSRQLIRPQFAKDRVSDLETFESHVAPLLDLLGPAGTTVDIKSLFFRFTLDAATDFLLGNSVDSLHNPQIEFAEAFAEIQRIQNIIARVGPAQVFIPRKEFNRHIKTLNDFVEPYITQALSLSPEELEKRAGGSTGYTFLHAIANYTRDRTVLRDQLVAVLLAGRDTTACTLSWTFYELARHPHVVERLRREIESVVGLQRHPTYADLKSMRFLQHIMNETLRLYPVVPFNVRVALKDTTLPHGAGPDGLDPVGVPEGTPVGYSTHYMQLIERNYPPVSETFSDPALFDPSRWEHWQPKHWTYIPFNGGPRLCVGQQFALTEMGYTIVRILQRFSRVELHQDSARGPVQGFRMPNLAEPLGEKKNVIRSGKALAERMVEKRVAMKSEIVLSPSKEIKVAFLK